MHDSIEKTFYRRKDQDEPRPESSSKKSKTNNETAPVKKSAAAKSPPNKTKDAKAAAANPKKKAGTDAWLDDFRLIRQEENVVASFDVNFLPLLDAVTSESSQSFSKLMATRNDSHAPLVPQQARKIESATKKRTTKSAEKKTKKGNERIFYFVTN